MPGSCCQSRCHLRLSGWVEGGGKKGKKGEGGRASADLEGLSGRGGKQCHVEEASFKSKVDRETN